jgi:hypothetical protein
MKQLLPLRLLLSLFLCFVTCAALGCGGGTTGSGDASSLKVSGTVTSPEGRPLSARVTDLESGESTQSDEKGAFTLSARGKGGVLSLDVSTDTTSGTISVPNIPDGSSGVSVAIVVDSVSGVVTLASVEIEQEGVSSNDPTKITQSFKGTVLSRSGKPVKDALITVRGTTAQQTTDTSGRFLLSSHSRSGKITLLVRFKGYDGSVVISGVPRERSSTIKVRLTLAIDAGQDPGNGGGETTLSITVTDINLS